MKKKLTLLALAIVASLGISAAAQTPCNKPCEKQKCEKQKCEQQQKCDKQKCDKPCDKQKCDKPCDKQKCAKQQCAGDPFLEGITLSAEQQTKIDAIKADRKKAAAEGKNPCRRDFLAKMKEVLSPEQYVTYLENMVLKSPARRHHGDKAMRGGHGPKDKMARKCDKAVCPAASAAAKK